MRKNPAKATIIYWDSLEIIILVFWHEPFFFNAATSLTIFFVFTGYEGDRLESRNQF